MERETTDRTDVPPDERDRLKQTDPTNPARLPTDSSLREPEAKGRGNLAATDPD